MKENRMMDKVCKGDYYYSCKCPQERKFTQDCADEEAGIFTENFHQKNLLVRRICFC